MEYVILIIVIAVLALGTGSWLLFLRPRRGRAVAAPAKPTVTPPASTTAESGGTAANGPRDGNARGRAAAAGGGPPGAAARPAGPVAELDGLGAAEPAVQGPARRRHLGRDRRGADHRRRGRGAGPGDGRRPAHQGQGTRLP